MSPIAIRITLTPLLIIIGVSLITCNGCSSLGIKKRIAEKSAIFENLTPHQKKNIRSGFIEKEFTKDMVYIAMGNPSEIKSKDSPLGMVTTWVYKNHYPTTAFTRVRGSDPTQRIHVSSQALGGLPRRVPLALGRTDTGPQGLGTDSGPQGLGIADLPTDTLYVVFIENKVFGISLGSEGGPIEL